ncbi:MAG: UDP-N-acetylmuramoyl-tripeptide--D-alanyl-D-alanine ligase [Kiritimatiellae bacterium]|nr:UDP-N-acetylmuramoyl-tripeptide--D-alanyl-D-alanine ligase [Kiritimatiellia bacterium]
MSGYDPGLFAQWAGGTWCPAPPARLAGVSTDTRTLRPGELFVALSGPNFDGHEFVEAAFDRQAAGAMVREGRLRPFGVERPLLVVADPLEALRGCAEGYRLQVDPDLIGITGSVGKTAVKEMVAGVLSMRLRTARSRGNWNNHIGVPLSLLAMPGDTQVGVFELATNHPGEIRALTELLRPDCGIVTNVGPAHLEFFGSLERIAQEKADLLRGLPPDGLAVLASDLPCFDVLAAAVPCRLVTVGERVEADYACEVNAEPDRRMRVRERATGCAADIRLGVPGRHNMRNALFAVALARVRDIAWDDIQAALERYLPLAMRWERHFLAGIEIVNDAYNANPMSMQAALDTFGEIPAPGRKWLVLGGMLELGPSEEAQHRSLGRAVAEGRCHRLVTVGARGKWIADGACRAHMAPDAVTHCAGNAEAVSLLRHEAAPGDAILLKASRGMRFEQILAGLKQAFEG